MVRVMATQQPVGHLSLRVLKLFVDYACRRGGLVDVHILHGVSLPLDSQVQPFNNERVELSLCML